MNEFNSCNNRLVQPLRHQLQAFTQGLARELQAEPVTIVVYDETTNEFHLPVGCRLRDEETFTDPRMLPRTDGILGQIVRDRRELVVEVVRGDPLFDGPFARREGVLSAAGFPLIHGNRALGVVFVNYRKRHTFTDDDKKRIRAAADQAAAAIDADDPFDALRSGPCTPPADEEEALRVIVQFARTVLNLPIAVWLLEADGKNLRLRAHRGLTVAYLKATSAPLDEGSYLNEVVATKRAVSLPELELEGKRARFRYVDEARDAGWTAAYGIPVHLRGRVGGVLEVFCFNLRKFGEEQRNSLRLLAELASITLENTYRTAEARSLAEAALALRDCPDFTQALQVIVENALNLTKADSSIVFLFNKRTDGFVIGSRSKRPGINQLNAPRPRGGLTRAIFDTGTPELIGDTTATDRPVRKELVDGGVRSLAGVRIQIGKEPIGVLYINGSHTEQFTSHDVELLKTLADQASLALRWARMLLKPSDEIEEATSRLANLDERLGELCKRIKRDLQFDFVAVQLIRPEEDTIETVKGIDQAEAWASRAKHNLERNADLQDIQAAIALAQPPCVEIIVGWDKRLDRWILDTFKHDRFVRVYTPLALVRDEGGRVLPDGADRVMFGGARRETNPEGERTVIEMSVPDGLQMEVIGTVEAGYCDCNQHSIEPGKAIAMTKLATRGAVDVRRTLLPYVLEAIAERAMLIVRADAASLHFQFDAHRQTYKYQVCSGQLGRQYLALHPPRANGLGRQAIDAGEPRFIPDAAQDHAPDELRRLNPELYRQGMRAMAAIPLSVDDEKGVLYICFRSEHWFTEAEIAWLQPFANWALDAIRQATRYTQMRDRSRLLVGLHAVAESLVSTPNESDLLRHFAQNALPILVADVVTVYEYVEVDKRFKTPPLTAGRLLPDSADGPPAEPGRDAQDNSASSKPSRERLRPGKMETEIREDDVPALLVGRGRNFYADRTAKNSFLRRCASKRPAERGDSFVVRERIVSSAGILLKAGKETVGVMFVNYRRPHHFSKEEKALIGSLASTTAFAIKNRRLMEALSSVDGDIINTADLQQVLDLIAAHAARITNARFGAIRQPNFMTQSLDTTAVFPARGSAKFDPAWAGLVTEGGIVHWVAASRKPTLLNDCSTELRFSRAAQAINSELCVPLLAKGGRLLGVLHVADPRTKVFHWLDQHMLEALANQAVIAIQNAENQRHLLAASTIAALGDLAHELGHHDLDNMASTIRKCARDIQKGGATREQTEVSARQIEALAEKLAQAAKELQTWMVGRDPMPVHLRHALSNALDGMLPPPPKNVVLNNSLPPDLPPVLGSGRQLRQVFEVLIHNAIEAMPVGGEVVIGGSTSYAEEGWVTFWVADTGVGIAGEDLENVFKCGYTTKENGLGFGLWWARLYIERLRGRVVAASDPGKGSRFTIKLPAAPPDPD